MADAAVKEMTVLCLTHSLFFSVHCQVVSGSWDCTSILWDLRTGYPELTIQGHSGVVCQAVFADPLPSPRRVLTSSDDKTLKLWDLRRNGTVVATLRGHTDSVKCCAVSGDFAVSGSDDHTVRTWLLPP